MNSVDIDNRAIQAVTADISYVVCPTAITNAGNDSSVTNSASFESSQLSNVATNYSPIVPAPTTTTPGQNHEDSAANNQEEDLTANNQEEDSTANNLEEADSLTGVVLVADTTGNKKRSNAEVLPTNKKSRVRIEALVEDGCTKVYHESLEVGAYRLIDSSAFFTDQYLSSRAYAIRSCCGGLCTDANFAAHNITKTNAVYACPKAENSSNICQHAYCKACFTELVINSSLDTGRKSRTLSK